MIQDAFVIDGVAHAYDFSDDNRIDTCDPERYRNLQHFAYMLGHESLESLEPGYLLTLDEFTARWKAEDLAHSFFVESDVDMVVHHSVAISSYFRDGAARWDTGVELKRIAPDRVLLYGCVDTFEEDRGPAFDEMEKMASDGAVGFKFYPSNGFFDTQSNRLVTMIYDHPERAFPFFEKARDLGVTHLAFHKAQPVGPGPIDAVRVEDISTAAMAFPDLTFEIVHDGWAFLEESAIQLMLHPNIYANLECVANLVVRQPRRFAHIIGKLLQYGGPDRILYATGCAVNHADPILRAFMAFEMPEDLHQGHGYPELTAETKRKLVGENMARVHGIDIEQVKNRIKNDQWSELRAEGKAEPWSAHRASIAGRAAQAVAEV
ncbi:amidohydrolase family protein [soil metagenome]